MTEYIGSGAYLLQGKTFISAGDPAEHREFSRQWEHEFSEPWTAESGRRIARGGTIAYQIFKNHNHSAATGRLRLKFDSLASHDITYVGIIQTAIASGMKQFPLPYVLTNCHNSLCAVGGTINEDDHVFGRSAAEHFGGIFVPPHQAVIHQYVRETMAGCGKMILGSDSHTRYGALGALGIGEGGPELVKQLLEQTYDIDDPPVVAVYLTGKPRQGVGPQDVALSLIGAVFSQGFVKNKVLEFIGPGIAGLSVDFRNGIDVMTTETTCLSSIWQTDKAVAEYYRIHGRSGDYQRLTPAPIAYYDGVIKLDLSSVVPMIALPFHPSQVYSIAELQENPGDILREVEKQAQEKIGDSAPPLSLTDKIVDGKVLVDQGIVAGCSGGSFENITAMSRILSGKSVGNGKFGVSVYPASQPIALELMNQGALQELMSAGAVVRTAFCGPCFGAGDTPANQGLSIRHVTRNFLNREGANPTQGQMAAVALMDARSIAATALRGGTLTAATEIDFDDTPSPYHFDSQSYERRVYQGFGRANPKQAVIMGPNIAGWPKISPLPDHLLLQFAAVLQDPVTTTDELIPSGETSSYRSNPYKLAEFTLFRKDPKYVGRAKAIQKAEKRERLFSPLVAAGLIAPNELASLMDQTGLGSVLAARKPGDGSAREQAASCQRVLGGAANIAIEYATKRYRSNVINWGMIPFTVDLQDFTDFSVEDFLFLPNVRQAISQEKQQLQAFVVKPSGMKPVTLRLEKLSQDEREVILSGCLMNYYSQQK